MSRMYTVVYSGTFTAAGTDVDWFALKPADDKPIRLRGLKISQTSEVGDAAEEGLQFDILKLPATVSDGSGGSAPTPQPVDDTDTAAGFTARCNDTTIGTTSGTILTKEKFGWNERNTPYETYWDERSGYVCRQGEALVLRQQTTLADDMTGQPTIQVEEI